MIWTPKAHQNVHEAHRLLGPSLGKISDRQDRAAFYFGLAMPSFDRAAEQDAPEYEKLPEHGQIYWRRSAEGYELIVDGHVRATAWHDNSYEIHGSEFGRRALPDSRLHFQVVERKLALKPVEDFRDADGQAISRLADPRARLEREARDVRENLGPEKEPIAYLRAALNTLENDNKRGEKSTPEAREAATMLATALTDLDGRNNRWTRPLFSQVFRARDLIRQAIEEERIPAGGAEARAEQLCRKALACIGSGDIEKEEAPANSKDSLRDAAIAKAAHQDAAQRDREQDRDRD
jgi:hypothetical protein